MKNFVLKWCFVQNMSAEEKKRVVPRVCIFAGKAAPGYEMAKLIVKLINETSKKINSDPDVGNLLKVVGWASFLILFFRFYGSMHFVWATNLTTCNANCRQFFIPDYNVSVAELIIPASDLSQHIRCALTFLAEVLLDTSLLWSRLPRHVRFDKYGLGRKFKNPAVKHLVGVQFGR